LGFDVCEGDLLERVLSGDAVDEPMACVWGLQLIDAIAHLHACCVVHLDVKLENIFLDGAGRIKLGDLGLAAVSKPGGLMRKMCGSGIYTAPEVLQAQLHGPYDGRAADVWSFAVCLFVMVRCRFPFVPTVPTKALADHRAACQLARADGAWPPTPPLLLGTPPQRDQFSAELLELLDRCLSLEPSLRPTVAQVAASAWMRGARAAGTDASEAVPSPVAGDVEEWLACIEDGDQPAAARQASAAVSSADGACAPPFAWESETVSLPMVSTATEGYTGMIMPDCSPREEMSVSPAPRKPACGGWQVKRPAVTAAPVVKRRMRRSVSHESVLSTPPGGQLEPAEPKKRKWDGPGPANAAA
jgi:serine/threonine protein kinase